MAGQDAWGTAFRRDTTGLGVFETVANCTDISGPSREREAIEVTAHDSPDQYREFVKGLKDGGEVELTLNYDPNVLTHQHLDDDFEERDLRTYQVVIFPGEPEEWTWEFSGLITNLGEEFPHDDKMERTCTVKISGKPTFTHTAGS
jgi:predicted secreted protein